MNIDRQDRRVAVFLATAVILLSLYANSSYLMKEPAQFALLPPFGRGMDVNLNRQLGFEYRYIAEAIVAGKGFSNPFNANTGPTAWMPPVYPALLAILIKIFGSINSVAVAVVILKNIVLVIAGLTVYMAAKNTASAAKAYWAAVIYLVFLISDFSWFFQVTHDDWLILLLLSAMYVTAIFLWSDTVTAKKAAVWGVIGGVGILSSPVLGYVWMVLTFIRILRSGGKRLVISAVIFLALLAPWVARNYLHFHKIIPVKSNLLFDAYQANYRKNNGLVTRTTFDHHPYVETLRTSKSEYKTMGEDKFLEHYKGRFLSAAKKDPLTFLRKIKNRFFASTLVYFPYDIYVETDYNGWKNILHPLPFICICWLLISYKRDLPVEIRLAAAIYAVFLLPYIVFSYYVRYAIPLTPLKALFVFWAFDRLVLKKE